MNKTGYLAIVLCVSWAGCVDEATDPPSRPGGEEAAVETLSMDFEGAVVTIERSSNGDMLGLISAVDDPTVLGQARYEAASREITGDVGGESVGSTVLEPGMTLELADLGAGLYALWSQRATEGTAAYGGCFQYSSNICGVCPLLCNYYYGTYASTCISWGAPWYGSRCCCS